MDTTVSFWSLITGTAVSFTRGLSSRVPLCLTGLSSWGLLCLLPEEVSHHGYHCVFLVSHHGYCCVFYQRLSLIMGTTVSFWSLIKGTAVSFTKGGLSSRVPLCPSPEVVSHYGYHCLSLEVVSHHGYHCLSQEVVSHHGYHCLFHQGWSLIMGTTVSFWSHGYHCVFHQRRSLITHTTVSLLTRR